jgi:RND family efflux transporter MFP subunit
MNNRILKKLWQRRSGKIALIACVVVMIVTLLAKRGGDADSVDMDTAHLSQVQRGDLVVSILQSGELVAKSSRQILNEAYRDAKIIEVVDDGAAVTDGQLLFELESSELMERYLDQQSDVAEAEANLKLAQETLAIARLKNTTDVESAKLKVELAVLDLKKYEEVEYAQMKEKAESDIMLAEEELKRSISELEGTQELYDKGYSNKNDLDSDRLSVQRKEVEVRNKTAELKILKEYTHTKKQKELENAVVNAKDALLRLEKTNAADIESKEASIISKKTRLEIEKNQLTTREVQFANTKSYADFSGQVFYPKPERYGSMSKIEKGATVQFRQAILSFPDLTAWDLKVGIPEAMIDKVNIGQAAVATLDAVPGLVLHGQIEKISAVPDSQGWFSTGVKTYAIVINVTSEAMGQLKPGMSATVEIVTDRLLDVLYVPIQSVVSSEGKHYVYVVKRGRKQLREVEIGKFNNQSIEITSGLEEGEELLLYAEVELEAETKLKKSPLAEESKTKEADAGEAQETE